MNLACMCTSMDHRLFSEVSSFATRQYESDEMICTPFLIFSAVLHLEKFLALYMLEIMIF